MCTLLYLQHSFNLATMDLPNNYFEGFPIEFKEINPSDFPGFKVENDNNKIVIEPDEQGYINDAFQAAIDLRHKNTVVVNAAVGQGKSTAIIKTIGKYYHEHPDTVIIVASPFVSLVEQYCNDIKMKAGIPEEQIYNYGSIGRDHIDYRLCRVQVITVNTLLGNPGEDSIKNSKEKRVYLNSLLRHCELNNLKVVFIYDEIHDAIQNFKEEYIFNLWKWRDVIFKNYILSATYNEASKIVIEYLAELTEKKIQIIESKRIIYHEKQSRLYLHYSPADRFNVSNPELVKIIQDLVAQNKDIDILSFSKKLAKEIIQDEEGIGKIIKDKFGEINDCTSELNNNQRSENAPPTNRYNNRKCNIGTNFKTGISIEKENHAFVIILPGRGTRMEFSNQYGIFSGGINSIIQALARQRKKGDIHILLPNPDKFNYRTLEWAGMDEQQIQAFEQFYESIRYYGTTNTGTVNYFRLDAQDRLLSKVYLEDLYENVSNEIEYIASINRDLLVPLRYPAYKLFKLNKGENFLAGNYEFFGKDVAAYLTYSAITNQFINCKLEDVNFKPVLYFDEREIQNRLYFFYKEYFDEYEHLKHHITFSHFYDSLRTQLFNSFKLKLKSSIGIEVIKPFHREFESSLMLFCGIQYFGRSFYYWNNTFNSTTDVKYSRGMYFLDSLAIAQTLRVDELSYPHHHKNKVKAYQNLGLLRGKLIDKISRQSRGNIQYNYLPVKPTNDLFSREERDLIIETISLLIEFDDFLKNDTFNFKRNLFNSNGSAKPLEKQIESFYKMLVFDFFEMPELDNYPVVTMSGERVKVKPIIQVKALPYFNATVDTLRIDPLIVFANEHYGSFEAYQETLNNFVAQ